ncbi:MAG: hypothetical protein HKL96_07280 [Phycisphaerales bacterium]|nr:hypothetical protein [Phycisphaerales bacterium]
MLVLLVFYAVSHFSAGAGSVSLTVTMPPFSPAVVKVGSSATTTLHAIVGSNYNPPVPTPDEGSLSDKYTWSLKVLYSPTAAGKYTDAGTPGPKNYLYAPNPLPSASPVPLVFTPEKAGYWKVSVSCSVLVKDSKNSSLSWSGAGKAGPDGLTSAIVTFSPDPIETGADKMPQQQAAIFVPVTATVAPKDIVSSVSVNNFSTLPGGTGSAGVDNSHPNISTGQITFDLYGITGTAPSMPTGDVKLQAKDGSTVLGSVLVTVEVPKAIGTPHPTFNHTVTSENKALDASSVPAYWGLNAGQVELYTMAGTALRIKVIDQFGDRLGSIYNEQAVYEGGKSINVTVSNGYYSDYVGIGKQAPVNTPNPCPNGSPAEQNFLAGPTLAIPNGSATQNIQVEIAGFTLNPSVVKRTVTYNNGTLTVTWP